MNTHDALWLMEQDCTGQWQAILLACSADPSTWEAPLEVDEAGIYHLVWDDDAGELLSLLRLTGVWRAGTNYRDVLERRRAKRLLEAAL